VCDNCGYHFPADANRRIRQLADRHTFHELDAYLFTHPRGLEYAQRVREARHNTHLRESVVAGTAQVQGYPLVLVVLDFYFLGGTMGAAAGAKIARAFERAAELRLPIVAVTATGGARIQEGMVALLQMARTAAAVNEFRRTGLPYVAVLHPDLIPAGP
jgi:acetyl-CoA carboxylase carboxyl transferase subunit beta